MVGGRAEGRHREERGKTASPRGQWPWQERVRAEENQGQRSPRCAGQAVGGRFLATPLFPGRERHQQRTRCSSVQITLGERAWFVATGARKVASRWRFQTTRSLEYQPGPHGGVAVRIRSTCQRLDADRWVHRPEALTCRMSTERRPYSSPKKPSRNKRWPPTAVTKAYTARPITTSATRTP